MFALRIHKVMSGCYSVEINGSRRYVFAPSWHARFDYRLSKPLKGQDDG